MRNFLLALYLLLSYITYNLSISYDPFPRCFSRIVTAFGSIVSSTITNSKYLNKFLLDFITW